MTGRGGPWWIAATDTNTREQPLFARTEEQLGVLPDSTPTMAHRPPILQAFAGLDEAVMGPGVVPQALKQLVATVTFEDGPLFGEAERAALRVLAQRAGVTPNEMTDDVMAALRAHFSDPEVVELVAVIAVFGFLDRWNDTMASQLEQSPLAYADVAPVGVRLVGGAARRSAALRVSGPALPGLRSRRPPRCPRSTARGARP